MPNSYNCEFCGARWVFYTSRGSGANYNKGMVTQHRAACEKRTPAQRRQAANRMWKAKHDFSHPGMKIEN